MNRLDKASEDFLDYAEGNVTLLLIWGFLLFVCCLAAFAIHDYEMGEKERLERVHAAGLAMGSTLCGRYAK